MNNQVATEIIRDFLKVLGPKIPKEFYDYTVETEMTITGSLYHVFKFKLPESLKKELLISNNMLPMFASSMENLLLSKMVSTGVNGDFKLMFDFIQSLPKFKKSINIYFKGIDVNTVFEFV